MNIVGWFRFYRNAQGLIAFFRDQAVSKWHKAGVAAMTFFTAIYVLSPLDLIPDVLAPAILLVAFLDDLGFMAICFLVLNQIGMRYAESHQLPIGPSNDQLPRPNLSDLESACSGADQHPRAP
ncbi:hypothetical protein HZC53_04860 [Candidatus Uhrbacteria bacterium]|nr:hypothetical protein [Candidatus Uhrbacteria bacterium]